MSRIAGFTLGNGQSATSNALGGTIPTTGTGGSVAAGDIVVVAVQSTESTPTLAGPDAGGAPSGWSVIAGPIDLTGTSTAYVIARTVTSSGAGSPGSSFTVDWSETRRLNGAGVVLRGVTLTGLITANLPDSVSSSNATIATVSSVPAGSDLLAFTLLRRGASTPTDITAWPAAWSIEAESKTAYGSIPNLTSGAFYQAGTAGGTYGGGTVDTDTANVSISITVALPSASQDFTTSAGLSGTGTLSTTAGPVGVTTSAALSGTGTLSAIPRPAVSRAAALSGSGTLSAVPRPGFTRAAGMSGDGTLQAVPFGYVFANLSGEGTLTASPRMGVARTAALSGQGTLSAVPRPSWVQAAALSGVGTLSTTQRLGVTRSAGYSGSGALTAIPTARYRFALYTGGLVYLAIPPKTWDGSTWRTDIPVDIVPATT